MCSDRSAIYKNMSSFSCFLIGQLFLAHDTNLVLETCLNLSYLDTDVSKRVLKKP